MLQTEGAAIESIDIRTFGVLVSGPAPVALLTVSEAALVVILSFFGQLIVASEKGCASTAEGLVRQFREFITDTAKRAADIESK